MSALFPDIIQCMPIQVLEIKKSQFHSFVLVGVQPRRDEGGPGLRVRGGRTDVQLSCLVDASGLPVHDQLRPIETGRHAACHSLLPRSTFALAPWSGPVPSADLALANNQDSESHNPLIRALSLRTMTSIPLPSTISAVIDPLRHGLKDSDPYVRKTAALSVAKLYATPPGRATLDRSPHFIGALRDLLADANPTVVANAVAALVEISERSEEIALRLNVTVAGKLVAALNECSEYVALFFLRVSKQDR